MPTICGDVNLVSSSTSVTLASVDSPPRRGTHLVVNHEPQRVGNVALERHQRASIEQAPERHLASFERAANLGVGLELRDGDFEEGGDRVAFVAPEGALVGDGDGVDRTKTGEEGALRVEERESASAFASRAVHISQRASDTSSALPEHAELQQARGQESFTHVQVLHQRLAVGIGEVFRRRDPEVGEEARDVKEDRVAGL